jgi:hypothetical protein
MTDDEQPKIEDENVLYRVLDVGQLVPASNITVRLGGTHISFLRHPEIGTDGLIRWGSKRYRVDYEGHPVEVTDMISPDAAAVSEGSGEVEVPLTGTNIMLRRDVAWKAYAYKPEEWPDGMVLIDENKVVADGTCACNAGNSGDCQCNTGRCCP